MVEEGDKNWVCPSDRHLSLRAKLNCGWCVRATLSDSSQHAHKDISEDELSHIKHVVDRAQNMDSNEQQRIGQMIHRLDLMRSRCSGDGERTCVLCAEKFAKFIGVSPRNCMDCKKNVCSKCSVSAGVQHGSDLWLCKICSESREVWKRSGAWFFRTLPKFVLPDPDPPARATNHKSLVISPAFDLPPPNSSNIYNHRESISIGRRRRSSSSESSDNESIPRSSITSRTDGRSSSTVGDVVDSLQARMSSTSHSSVRSFPDARQRISSSAHDDVTPTSSIDDVMSSLHGSDHVRATSRKSVEQVHAAYLIKTRQGENGNLLHTCQPVEGSLAPPSPTRWTAIGGYSKVVSWDKLGFLGSLEFDLYYDNQKQTVDVTIIRAKGLKASDANGFSDPYVKVYLLPGVKKSTKRRTSTKRKTLNPEFNETVTYWGVSEDDLRTRVLQLKVYDEDRIGSEFLGETVVELRELLPSQKKRYDVALEQRCEIRHRHSNSDRGKILLALRFDDVTSALQVTVIRCASLLMSARTIDPQVKVRLHSDNASFSGVSRRTERRKSSRRPNPVFDDVMSFPVPGGISDLSSSHLDVSVWDRDVVGREQIVGYVSLGVNSTGSEMLHWFEWLKNPGQAIEKWHALRYPDDSKIISALAGKRRKAPILRKTTPK